MCTVFETDKPSKWRPVLSQRIPVQIGSMSDSFIWMDYKYKVIQELLRILNFYKYPNVIFTRSDLAAHEDYLQIYDSDLTSIQFSISGSDEKLTKQLEPGAPSAARRLKALKTLTNQGIWTTVRLNPFFPTHPDGFFTRREQVIKRFGSESSVPTFPWFQYELLDQIKSTGTPGVLAGVVRLSPFAVKGITRATGIDCGAFFNPEENFGSKDRRYSDSEISFYYSKLRDRCHKIGLRFNTCYIGNGIKDFYQYQKLWDNKKDCCDVIGNVSEIKGSSQDVKWNERIRHARCKDKARIAEKMDRTFRTDV